MTFCTAVQCIVSRGIDFRTSSALNLYINDICQIVLQSMLLAEVTIFFIKTIICIALPHSVVTNEMKTISNCLLTSLKLIKVIILYHPYQHKIDHIRIYIGNTEVSILRCKFFMKTI